MSSVQVLSLLLALSLAVNIGCGAGLIAARADTGWARALLVAGGAAGSSLGIIFAGVAAYR